MDFIFNELCFQNTFPETHSAKLSMQNLLQVCKEGRELGMRRLAIRPDFYEQLLLLGYSINDWLNDKTVSRVFKDLLLSIVRQPYIDDSDIVIQERFISSYAFLNDEKLSEVEGLAIAYLYQTIAISLYSSDDWRVHEISLKFSEFGFEDQVVKVNHASQSDNFEHHKDWIASRIGIKLSVTAFPVIEKEISLRDDHGKNVLLSFSKKLVRSPYVNKVINSLPFNPHDNDFIKRCYEDGKIELVLVRSDQGLGIIVQTTGRNLAETNAIAAILCEEFQNEY
jgi:hypothetical protein